MPTFPKSKSIFEPKIYIPAFAGITYEECIVPHNSPREDNDDGPLGMFFFVHSLQTLTVSQTLVKSLCMFALFHFLQTDHNTSCH
jgi:hypothetical protein